MKWIIILIISILAFGLAIVLLCKAFLEYKKENNHIIILDFLIECEDIIKILLLACAFIFVSIVEILR